MADVNWLAVGAGVLSGGAAGAIINNLWTAVRNRKQPIGYRVEVVPVFTGQWLGGHSNIMANLTLHDPTVSNGIESLPNLSIAQITVENRGNKDFTSFQFGMTLSTGDSAVHCYGTASDRHHHAKLATQVSVGLHASEIDVELTPFNRSDVYTFTLYLVASEEYLTPRNITLSSKEPVIFTQSLKAADLAETLADALPLMVAKAISSAFSRR